MKTKYEKITMNNEQFNILNSMNENKYNNYINNNNNIIS